MEQEWRPVVGYEGLYEISSEGNVRTVARKVLIKRSRLKKPNRLYFRTFPSRDVKVFTRGKSNIPHVHLHRTINGILKDYYHSLDELMEKSFSE